MAGTFELTVLDNRYQLGEQLGRGGMGTVYRAHDQTLNRDVAVKVLSNSGLGTEGRDRLLHEAQAIAQLSHPNIVSVFDAGEQDGTPYIVMELVKGASLHDRPPSDMQAIAQVAAQVCAALEHAHTHGVVHRDLKPENVLIAEDGTAKLMDFGIARSVASRMTTEGEIAGTVFYLAPEIALGKEFDGRADLYSLGVMLYELTTGELPFSADDPLAVISQHLHVSLVPPKAKRPEIPPLLDALIVQLMSKAPEDRPPSAMDVRDYLERSDLYNADVEGQKEVLVLDRIVRGRFVGREQELSEARSVWSKASGGDGQTLLLSGEPGIGKTRLMRELSTHVEVTGGRALVGACYAEGGAPYSPFAQIVRKALENGASKANGKAHDLPDFVLADLLSLAPELKPYFPDVPPNPPLEPRAEQQRLFENVVAFCSALSKRAPLMLVVDDAHWADGGSLSLLRHLARRLKQKPVLLMATYREVELDEARPFNEVLLDLNRERLARRIKLSRLSRQQTGALLGALFEDEITPEFLDGIYRETEGNPFFVEEVCKALVESGKLYYADGDWHRPGMDELEIPQSVKVAIQARISTMPEEHQEVLRLAAVLGREFDYDTLQAASESEESALIEALEAAEHAQLINEAGGVRFEFAHALIPTTLVESLHTLRRRVLHREAAAAIETLRPKDYEALAYHHGEAGNDEQALKYYMLAGDLAARAFVNQDAESHYRAALNLAQEEELRAQLLSNIGVAVATQGRFDEAIEIWDSAIAIYMSLDRLDRAAWCYARSSRAAWEAGDTQRGLDISRAGLAAVGHAPDTEELADLLHEAARACYFNGVAEEARALCSQSRQMAEKLGAVQIEAEALITEAVLDGTSTEEAVAILERAIELAKEHHLAESESRARNNLSVMLGVYRGNVAAAREHLQEAARIAHANGMIPIELFYRAAELGWSIHAGDFEYADAEFARLNQLHEQLGRPGQTGHQLHRMAAHLAHFRGDLDLANELYNSSMEEARAGGMLQDVNWTGMWYADVLIQQGDLEKAKTVLSESMEAGANVSGTPRPFFQLASIQAREGQIDLAEKTLVDAETKFAADPTAIELPWVESARAHIYLAKSQKAEAWKHFEGAVAHARSNKIRSVLGIFMMDWANALIEHGEGEDIGTAKALVEEARALFESLDAANYVAVANQVLERIETAAS